MSIQTYVANITAFNEDESLNIEAYEKLVMRQLKYGNSIFCNGTNGEFFSLTKEEKLKVVSIAAKAVNNFNNIITNIGCISTYETIDLGMEVKKLGVEKVAVISPWLVKCSQDVIFEHYKRIANALEMPVYIYNIPNLTGNSIEIDTIEKLINETKYIVGMKDSSGDNNFFSSCVKLANKYNHFTVYAGTDSFIYEGLNSGAKGCVSGLCNLVPNLVKEVRENFVNNNLEKASEAQNKIIALRNDIVAAGNLPNIVKTLMFIMNPKIGKLRLPKTLEGEEVYNKLKIIIDKHNLELKI